MDPQNTPKGEHYNLRWTKYLSNLSQIVFEHHINERLVDVTLVCEGQYIKAHKLVLSACSNFFQDMFKMNTNIPQLAGNFIHPFIVMNGINFLHLKHIIDFMYQGEIKVLDSDLEGVLSLGESLQVKGLCSVKLKQKIGLNNEVPEKSTPSKIPEQSQQPLQQSTLLINQEKSLLPLHQATTTRIQELSMSSIQQRTPSRTEEQSISAFQDTIPLITQEQSVPPLPEIISPRPHLGQVESNMNSENQQSVNPAFKSYSKVSGMNQSTPPKPLGENLTVDKSQEEPRNYSKITLDALAENNTPKIVHNIIREVKIQESLFTMPVTTSINQSDPIEESEEPVNKRIKLKPSSMIMRKSEMIKIKPTKTNFAATKPKSPTIKEEKLEGINRNTPPLAVDAEKDRKSEIPKPPNPFMIFATEWRKKLSVEHPDESSKEISIRLGTMWKNLSSENKEAYYQAAQAALKEHELKYPQTVLKPDPLRKKKLIVKSFGKLQNMGSQEIVDLQDDDDDLEIMNLQKPLDSSSQDSTTSSVLT